MVNEEGFRKALGALCESYGVPAYVLLYQEGTKLKPIAGGAIDIAALAPSLLPIILSRLTK